MYKHNKNANYLTSYDSVLLKNYCRKWTITSVIGKRECGKMTIEKKKKNNKQTMESAILPF